MLRLFFFGQKGIYTCPLCWLTASQAEHDRVLESILSVNKSPAKWSISCWMTRASYPDASHSLFSAFTFQAETKNQDEKYIIVARFRSSVKLKRV